MSSTITPTGPTAGQQAVEPYSYARTLKIDRQYKALCSGPPRGQDLGKWFNKWEKFYVEAKVTNHSNIKTSVITDHFLNSLKQTEPHLATIALVDLHFKRLSNEQTPTFMETLNLFRQRLASQSQAPGSSSTAKKSNRQTGNTPPKECVCGQMHWYCDCFYINESRRPKGWNPNPSIVKKIDDALKDPKVRTNVNKVMKKNSRG